MRFGEDGRLYATNPEYGLFGVAPGTGWSTNPNAVQARDWNHGVFLGATLFQVNWFRRGPDGRFLWPGYGDNARVLKWITERLDGVATALDTPIGHVPAPGAIDTTGLDIPRTDVEAALAVHVDEWTAEIPQIADWFTTFGDKLPAQLWAELDTLKTRLLVR